MSGFSYAIIGAGRTGRAAAYDLGRHGEASRIRLCDVSLERAQEAVRFVRQRVPQGVLVTASALDATDLDAVRAAVTGCDAVMSCAPYFLNAGIAGAVVQAGAHFNDLGGNTAVVDQELALDPQARDRGVSVVPDCGLAPGLVNVIGAAGIARFARASSVHLYCGGLPQDPQPPMGYALSFSIHGLINEYTGTALCLRAGQLTDVPALSEIEAVSWEGLPPLEAFVTTGGTSTAPRSFQGRVDDYDYKTMRYTGHVAQLRLLDALGLFSLEPVQLGTQRVVPRDLFAAVARPALSQPDSRDLILVRAVCEGVDAQGRRGCVVYQMHDRFDEPTGLSAMERMTAFPAAIVTWMQARGDVGPGARPLEQAVQPEPYLDEVRRRGLDITLSGCS